jgi:hypothetical protein
MGITPSDPDFDNVAAANIYSSESDREDGQSNPCAASVYTASESDFDDFQAMEVFHFSSDDESGVDHTSAVLGDQVVAFGLTEGNNGILSTPDAASIPTVQGPFNPQYFSSFPSSWINPTPGDDISDADGDSIVSEE